MELEQPKSAFIETELAKFDLPAAAIAELASQFDSLTIEGIDDKKGYGDVHAALMHVRGKRTSIERTRKLLKEDSLAFGRAVDSEAKRLTALLEPIETKLASKREAIDNEKERIRVEKAEAEARRLQEIADAENARIQTRADAMAAYGAVYDWTRLKTMQETEFETELAEAKKVWGIEQDRLKQAELDRAEEQQRLETQRVEQQRIADEQAAQAKALREQQERIDAAAAEVEREKQRIEDERLAKEAEQRRAEELEAAKKAAAEKAIEEERQRAENLRLANEAKARQERADAEAKELADREAAELEASQRPDKDKLAEWAEALLAVPAPALTTAKFQKALEARLAEVTAIANSVKAFAKGK